MRKKFAILLCLCALLLPGFTANDPEETAAVEIVRAYFDAVNQNDLETILTLSAQHRQDNFWASGDGKGDVFFKTMLLIFKDAEFVVTGAEKIDAEHMEVQVQSRFPDLEYVVNAAMQKVETQHGSDLSPEEMFAAMPPFIPAILADQSAYKMFEETFDIKVIKENGQWKVNESIND